MKKCSKCKVIKELVKFNKNKARYDGIDNYCKICKYILSKPIIKKYRINNKEKIIKKQKLYKVKNLEKIKKYYQNYNPIYYKKNKEKIISQVIKYDKQRYSNDIKFKIKINLRKRIISALKHNSKSKSTLVLLGCTVEELKKHLESQFKSGMSWENHGIYGWHIDHIKPCASFDLSNPIEQQKCFHYTNLQPLWAEDNLKKAAKKINKEK